MAYFALPAIELPRYRFDYRSRLEAILPVDAPAATASASLILPVSYRRRDADSQAEVRATVEVVQGLPLSLVGLFGGGGDGGQRARGQLALLVGALRSMERRNPLAALAASADRRRYRRGECAAENLYVACQCLAGPLGLASAAAAAATDPVLYRSVRRALERLQRRAPADGAARSLQALLPALDEFNRRIYDAGAYTPFEDACRARSLALRRLRATPGGETRYLQSIAMSLRSLEQQGVVHAQIGVGVDQVEAANAVVAAYNGVRQTAYKLLVRVAPGAAGTLGERLRTRILPLFEDPSLSELIGIDLSGGGSEDYRQWLDFLDRQSATLTQYFGAAAGARALQLCNRVDCGAGAGVATDQRSAIGYAMAYARQLPDAGFYRAYAGQMSAAQALERGDTAAGVFDALFRDATLSLDGLALRRYRADSEPCRALVAQAGRRDTMALCEALDRPLPGADAADAAAPAGSATAAGTATAPASAYATLAATQAPFGFRLGPAADGRSYFAARYPLFAFDTRLQAVAFDAFEPAPGGRLGYVDTDALQALSDRLMLFGLQALAPAQLDALMELVRGADSLADLLSQGQGVLQPMLAAALAPIGPALSADQGYAAFSALVEAMAGGSALRSLWFAALARALNLFINWRAYLLGSGGQGAVQSDVQEAFLRTVLLLAYALVPLDAGAQSQVGAQLQQLVGAVAAAYWQTSVGPLAVAADPRTRTATIAGYKAPGSVVTVTRDAAPA
ncbi:hypothetical protein K4L06_09675 [Lysobacter sp. BMK333-48F3]|uniref:hypothetical protein n=1 Tax=Lysobacter sp. BMK333-48F3 TaxID=2867962 RepID=UPI001C8B641C|nr:hypothetical protein [Lysobacter sp. BMK333-48F3]MBX9401581.1 hypothetical protein [Lysobacter sp. BMK333-48F3]